MKLAPPSSQGSKTFAALFQNYQGPGFCVRAPGGSWEVGGRPAFTLIFKGSDSLLSLLHSPSETKWAEAFIAGDIDVDGDIFAAFSVVDALVSRPSPWTVAAAQTASRIGFAIRDYCFRGALHSRRRDASSIAYHYDLPVAFYEPWLGPTLLYSAAYFRDTPEPLDRAQYDKLDLICRKLSLHSGERFLDVGCGWGSLTLHAAGHFGAEARGVTISREQAATAARRIKDANLRGSCFVDQMDYRDISQMGRPFDKAASVGMFEHVGLGGMRRYFETVFGVLRPGGLFLNSGIVRSASSPPRKDSFIDRYVFPDGELPTLSFALQQAEAAGFEIRDVENLREHYAATIRMWIDNLIAKKQQLLGTVTERIFRIWQLYLVGSAVAFERGDIGVCHMLLSRPDARAEAKPRTREDWYRPRPQDAKQAA
jgi:cyclopropane-fatty-acyl-phospholipid synthase